MLDTVFVTEGTIVVVIVVVLNGMLVLLKLWLAGVLFIADLLKFVIGDARLPL